MLSLRSVQVMVLFVLTVLLICPVGTYANDNYSSDHGWWPSLDDKQVFWKITAGKHSWNIVYTHSWHRVFIQNHSHKRLNVTWKQFHTVKNVDDGDSRSLKDEDEFWVAAVPEESENPQSYSDEKWLSPSVYGWLEEEDCYEIESKTLMYFENDDGEDLTTQRVRHVTTFEFIDP